VFTLATLLLAAVALGAGWLPALRASRTEPMRALRYD
jgi:ABC-type lipoprotein release transport system permease subunit